MHRYLIAAFTLIIATPLVSFSEEFQPLEELVTYVIDGDTFVTKSGKTVRLLNINTPETAKKGKPAQPYANKAKEMLRDLVMDEKVTLKFQKRLKDKYKRYLAEVYLTDGTWVNKELVSQGVAHVYTFPDNAINAEPLFKAEEIARNARKNIWSTPRWQVHNVDNIPDTSVGRFSIVKGTVNNIKKIKGRYYLNFGNDWRRDFTVEIPSKYWGKFKVFNQKIDKYYRGKTMIVRGFIKPVNGHLITVTHPQQLTVIE